MFSAVRSAVLKAFLPAPLEDGTRPRSHLFNFAVQLWIAMAVAVSVKCVVSPRMHTNYPHFEYGAKQWLAEEDMYAVQEVDGVRLDYRYSPAFAVAMVPLAALPNWLGGIVFSWLNVAPFFLAMRALPGRVLPGRWTPQREAVWLILVLAASLRMFWAVQSSPLVLALVVFGAIAARDRRFWLAAVLLAIPVHVKIWPVAAAMLLAACWPRQLLGRFAVGLAGAGLIPFLTKPFSVVCFQYHAWYAALVGPMQVRNVCYDAWTIWELIHEPVSKTCYLLLQLSTALLALALVLRQRRQGSDPRRLLTFLLALWTAWQMLFGPGTERNTFGVIAPLTSWALITALEARRGRAWMLPAFVLTTVLANGTVERTLAPWFPAVTAAHPLGVLLFAVWVVCYADGCDAGRCAAPVVREFPRHERFAAAG